VADVVRLYGAAYRRAHSVSAGHLRVMRDIERCRTAALGGHLERCGACGFERPAYDSCRNRHCPKCQSLAKAKWLQARQAELLPVPYFHAVFTLPHELNRLVLANPRSLLGLLFHAVTETLLTFGRNELEGTLGVLAVLHTWDQLLRSHFHLHCLIPGGALASDGSRWTPSPPTFLFRVEPLAKVFRGKFLDGLKKLRGEGRLVFPVATASPGTPRGFQRLVDRLYEKDWVVYCKPPFAGPAKVLDYLARYTHRVAISNHRILDVSEGQVRFRYRDRAHGDVVRTAQLPADIFLRRFLLHVLPDGLQRVRHYGLLANRSKKATLARSRTLLGPASAPAEPTPSCPHQAILVLTGVDTHRCPACGRPTLSRVALLAPQRSPPHPSPRSAPLRLACFARDRERSQVLLPRAHEDRSGVWPKTAVETLLQGVHVRPNSLPIPSSTRPGEMPAALLSAVFRPRSPEPLPPTTDTNPIEDQPRDSISVAEAASFNRLYPECRPPANPT
jgi:hypothetical protein